MKQRHYGFHYLRNGNKRTTLLVVLHPHDKYEGMSIKKLHWYYINCIYLKNFTICLWSPSLYSPYLFIHHGIHTYFPFLKTVLPVITWEAFYRRPVFICTFSSNSKWIPINTFSALGNTNYRESKLVNRRVLQVTELFIRKNLLFKKSTMSSCIVMWWTLVVLSQI